MGEPVSISPPRLDVFTSGPAPKEEKGDDIENAPQTPSEQHGGIWSIPSSSPLPSPGEMLRSLFQPRLHRRTIGNIMKGFRTARELLEQEQEKENKHCGGNWENQPTARKAPSEKKPKAKKAETNDETRVRRTATVSSHFPKRNKAVSMTSRSKDVPLGEQARPIVVCGDPTQPQAKRRKKHAGQIPSLNKNEDPILPVPTRRFDWTPVKNSVPLVEIIPSQLPKRKTPESSSVEPMRNFEDTIADFKYNSNFTSALRTASASTSIGSIGPTYDTTKRLIQVLKKPCSFPASTLTTGAESCTKKRTKKKQKVTELPTIEDSIASESPTVQNLQTAISSSTVTKIQAKRAGCRKKKEIVAKVKPKGKQKRTKGVAKEDTEEIKELLSPQSAIRRVNQQQTIFGNFSQLANDDDNICYPTPVTPRFGSGENLYDEEFEALEEFLHSEFGSSGAGAVKKGMKVKGLWDAAARNDGLADYIFAELSTMLGPDIQFLKPQKGAKEEGRRGNSRLEGITSSEVSGSIPIRAASDTPGKARLRTLDFCEPPTVSLISCSSCKRASIEPPPTNPTPVSSAEESSLELISLNPSKLRKRIRAKTPKKPVKASTDKENSCSKRTSESRSKTKTTSCKRTMSPSPRPPPTQRGSGVRTPEDAIHLYISKAILAEYAEAHSEVDITKTWHYRILLYQPIILEDLTEWLNTVGLRKVGMSCKVSPPEVREWADARAVLCVWELNRGGGERKMI